MPHRGQAVLFRILHFGGPTQWDGLLQAFGKWQLLQVPSLCMFSENCVMISQFLMADLHIQSPFYVLAALVRASQL